MARQSYIAFDFDNFTEQGLRKVALEFAKNDTPVIQGDDGGYTITATNKIKRTQGMPTKSAQFHFEDGQSATLVVNNEGSVFQVKLNTKIIPITNVGSFTKSIKEISNKVKANSKTFSKALARKAVKAHAADIGTGETPKRVGNSIPARLKAAKAALETARDDLAEAQSQAQEQQEKASQISGRLSQIKQKIQKELSRKEGLLQQLETLKAQVA